MLISRFAVAVAVLAIGPALAACSTGGGEAGVPSANGPTPTVTANPPDRRQWAQCMREHGIDVADTGKYDPGAFNKQQAGPAEQACRVLLPPDDLQTGPMDPTELELWRRWAQCMRDHGIDVEDPDPNGGPPGPRSTDLPLQQVVQAEEACQASAPPTHGPR
jgi:hypothetical protein